VVNKKSIPSQTSAPIPNQTATTVSIKTDPINAILF
jgi:hypothetical protein